MHYITLIKCLSDLILSYFQSVLGIRIRSDPKLFAGSGSGIINFGSDKLKFSATKKAVNLLSGYPLVTINFTFKNLFFKIKICAAVLFKIFLLPPYREIRSDPEPDPKCPEKSDPDPKKIISDPNPKCPEKSDPDPKNIISDPQH